MSVVVFTWDMFKLGKDGLPGVGHAAMHVKTPTDSVYISYWPAKTRDLGAALYSEAKLHFVTADRKEDGTPDWASRPLITLDEAKIIRWWSHIQANPLLDYKKPTAFQKQGFTQAAPGNHYNIVARQCSTTVVEALAIGADAATLAKIAAFTAVNVKVTVTPRNVRDLVTNVFGD